MPRKPSQEHKINKEKTNGNELQYMSGKPNITLHHRENKISKGNRGDDNIRLWGCCSVARTVKIYLKK